MKSSAQPAVFIETYGCSFNVADGEAMAGVLAQAGYQVVGSSARADVIVLNTCTVKDRTYWEFEKRLRELKAQAARGAGPQLVVAGCIAKAYERTDLLDGVATLAPDTVAQVARVVGEALAGRALKAMRPGAGQDPAAGRALLPVRRRQPNVEILPIASGCLSACSFCQTRLARGRLRSFRPEDLVGRARRALAEGVKEIWITAQDTGAYGRDLGTSLPKLLRRICTLEGDFRVRLGMSSPIWIREDLEETLDVLGHPKMFRFLHVPVQSGSDRVLRAMRREGTAAQWIEIAEAFSRRYPEGALLTDIIVGFPGEEEEDFAATLAMLERARPAAVNRSKFSARPGTAAARLKPLASQTLSERSLRAAEVIRRLARAWNERRLGGRGRVLTSENKPNATTLAHNEAYRPVILPGPLPPGVWVDVEYTEMSDFNLYGEIVAPSRR